METMDTTLKQENKFLVALKKVGRAFKNQTFLYIVKRVLSSLFTLVLLVALVTALIRLLPDTKFYDVGTYKKIAGTSKVMANRWRSMQLFLAGRADANGNPVPVLYSIGRYILNILPYYKTIPQSWTDYSCTTVLESWTGFVYLGYSKSMSSYVTNVIASRMGISFRISLYTIIFSYLFAVPLGIAMAKKPGGTVDKIGNVFIVLNYAIPGLVFYLVMWDVLGNANGAFGWANFGLAYDETRPLTLVPPIFCIVFLGIPGISIWVRRFMIDELSSDYVKFARSKGLSENRIMYTHVLRNAMVPLVRNIPATFLGAIIGSYYVEKIWTIPGTGLLLVNALQGVTPDIDLIEGLTVIYAAISMVSFLLGDLITVLFDPRIKLESN
jgi:ABC-type dipeptide/oligopeptide/nickel transport system permease component